MVNFIRISGIFFSFLFISSYALATDFTDVAVTNISFTPVAAEVGDTVTFTVTVNNGDTSPATSHAVYIAVILTNTVTLAETEIYSSAATIAAGANQNYVVTTTAVAGNYNVSAIPFPEDRRATQGFASSQLNVLDTANVVASDMVTSVTYVRPRERVTLTADVTNNDDDGQVTHSVYVGFVLTNSVTSVETEIYTAAKNISYGATSSYSATYTAQAGVYTVTAIPFAEDRRSTQAFASTSLRVIDPKDFVDPNVVNMGWLPYGRHMFPMPVKIYWAHEIPNQNVNNLESWTLRIYTDNFTKWKGTKDAIYDLQTVVKTKNLRAGIHNVNTTERYYREMIHAPVGLISSNGKYNIPLKVWVGNFGPDWDETGWNPTLLGPPSIHDDYSWKGPLLDDGTRDSDRSTWLTVPDYMTMTEDRHTWRRLIGVDPYDTEFTSDINPSGDYTLSNPFNMYLACETDASSVRSQYSTTIILEMYTP